MRREFVMTEDFDDSWREQSLADDSLRLLQDALLGNPDSGSVMRGAGGFRKVRFALPGCGKSGGVRVIYLDIPEAETLYLMLAYPKSEKDSLSDAEKNQLKLIAADIKAALRNRRGRNHV